MVAARRRGKRALNAEATRGGGFRVASEVEFDTGGEEETDGAEVVFGSLRCTVVQ